MKNWRMRSKFLVSFGSIILLTIVMVVFLLAGMVRIANSVDRLYSGPYENVNDVWTIRRNLIDIQRGGVAKLANASFVTSPFFRIKAEKQVPKNLLSMV